MFVWEVLAHRLRMQGYQVMRATYREGAELRHIVHLSRGAEQAAGSGPTLTEALADAARKGRIARLDAGHSGISGPHFEATRPTAALSGL